MKFIYVLLTGECLPPQNAMFSSFGALACAVLLCHQRPTFIVYL